MAEYLRDPPLNSRYVQERYPAGIVEGGQQVYIGIRPVISTRGRTEQGEMDDTCGPQFQLMPAQCGDHVLAIHIPIVGVRFRAGQAAAAARFPDRSAEFIPYSRVASQMSASETRTLMYIRRL